MFPTPDPSQPCSVSPVYWWVVASNVRVHPFVTFGVMPYIANFTSGTSCFIPGGVATRCFVNPTCPDHATQHNYAPASSSPVPQGWAQHAWLSKKLAGSIMPMAVRCNSQSASYYKQSHQVTLLTRHTSAYVHWYSAEANMAQPGHHKTPVGTAASTTKLPAS